MLIDYYKRHGIPLPRPEDYREFEVRIRPLPQDRGELTREEWDYLSYDPDLLHVEDLHLDLTPDERRRRALEELERLRIRAEKAREKRLKAGRERRKRVTGSLEHLWQ